MKSVEVLEQIKEVALKNASRKKSQKRRTVDLKVGDCFRQGDLYFHVVSNNHKVGDIVERKQLADGDQLGARHILTGHTKVYEGIELPYYVSSQYKKAALGYAFDILEKGVVATHPEHDEYVFPDKCRIQVTHQLDLRTLERVRD
jgi:hypothetical protein